MVVTGLFLYPVKSLPGIRMHEADVTVTGFRFDRRWMLVGKDLRAVTQREAPGLSQCKVSLADDGIRIEADGSHLDLPYEAHGGDPIEVEIWGDRVDALKGPPPHARWLSDRFDFDCQPVFIPDRALRTVDPTFAPQGATTTFTDGYPILVTSESSLGMLNARMREPLPMDRFRPNIVVDGSVPFDEDRWGSVTVGTARIRGVKPCSRCAITTIDTETGLTGKEPLQTLATFRRRDGHVYFGENFVVEETGRIRDGDSFTVRTRRGDQKSNRSSSK